MSVSVVIPAFNRAHTLAQAVNSVLAQSYKNYEIIIVDDGSTDTTKNVVEQFSDVVRYFYQDNKGPSAARNTGIRHAKGALIAFLDSDDVWREDKLSRQVACFEGKPQVGIVASGHELRNENWAITHVTLLSGREIRQIQRKDLYKNFFSTPSVVVRAECFKEVGCFDESIRYGEDWDMWLRILQKYDCSVINEPLVSVRVNCSGISTDFSESNICELYKVINKHGIGNKTSRFSTLMKRRSWFYINKAFVYQKIRPGVAKASLLKSIACWPFWYPARYYALLKW